MMQCDDTPDWIAQESQERQKTAAQFIRRHGVEFFGAVFLELKRNAKALPRIGAYGQISNLSVPGEAQQRFRADIALKGKTPGVTYSDLFYTPGRGTMKVRTMEDEVCVYRLCLLAGGEIGVIADGGFERLDAAGLAASVVKDAVERLQAAPAPF